MAAPILDHTSHDWGKENCAFCSLPHGTFGMRFGIFRLEEDCSFGPAGSYRAACENCMKDKSKMREKQETGSGDSP